MRQRERIIRVAAEVAEKSGLDSRSKEIIDSVLPLIDRKNITLATPVKKLEQELKEENLIQEQQEEKEAPVKRKNPLPPKKKKNQEATEEKS